MGSLRGKVIAITGAASGIGLATAHEAASRGATLALADISADALSKTIENLKAQGVNVSGTQVDVSDSQSVNQWVEAAVQLFGRIDGAVNVAGVVRPKDSGDAFTDIVNTTDEHWSFVLNINLTGLFYSLRAELRAIVDGGSVVNVSSAAGLIGRAGLAAYVSSKHGVIGLTKTAAKEVGGRGVRVNAVCPGPIGTPMLDSLLSEGERNASASATTSTYKDLPLGRTGHPIEVAKGICFLLSDESSYMTGVAMPIDAGLTS